MDADYETITGLINTDLEREPITLTTEPFGVDFFKVELL